MQGTGMQGTGMQPNQPALGRRRVCTPAFEAGATKPPARNQNLNPNPWCCDRFRSPSALDVGYLLACRSSDNPSNSPAQNYVGSSTNSSSGNYRRRRS